MRSCWFVPFAILLACNSPKETENNSVKKIDPLIAAEQSRAIQATIKPTLHPGLKVDLWAMDSLLADPVSIDIDDKGTLYYTRTNRQKSSEFDIRGHKDWEIESIALQSIEDKRNFLRRILAPENSNKNKWLEDVNRDSSHDWRDLTVQKEHVYQLKDLSGDGIADMSQLIIADFNDEVTDASGGVLKHGDDLFVAIGPDLWKINDKDGDGTADEKKSLSHGYAIHIGFGGHGMSGIEVGPEGKIYWQIGDIGFNGKEADGTQHNYANSGVICRANPDGSDFEVFAYGNRNTHEFVFDEYGNLISEDNDGDHAGERERLVYVVNGADIGWRINWQFGKYNDPKNNRYKVWMDEKLHVPHFEGQAAYVIPTIANYVNGPTGMLYNPGTALNNEWKNTFFVVEFVGNPSQSGIHAFKLKPKGATFELAETKKIMSGILATGMDFGPDGAIYFSDWIEGWRTKDYGRVWKLDVANPDTAAREDTRKQLAADAGDLSLEELSDLLRHPDMRVRQKSQFELAVRGDAGLEILKNTLAQKGHQLARIHSIWGISQFARKNLKHTELLIPYLNDSDPEIRAQAAKWIGDVKYKNAGDKLLQLLNDDYPRARFFAAEALGRIAYGPSFDEIVELLEKNNDSDVYIRHAGSLALARIGNALKLSELKSHPSKAVRIAAVVALRRMQHPGISEFLGDNDEYVVTEAARGINDDHSVEKAITALGGILNQTQFRNEALIRRSINANLRMGTTDGLQNLLTYASNKSNPVAMRAEAIAALSTWHDPSVLDRVDGRYRGQISRDIKVVQNLSKEKLMILSKDPTTEVRVSAVRALGTLQVEEAVSLLSGLLRTDRDAGVREEALRSINAISSSAIGEAISIALSDKGKNVRALALDLLPRSNLDTVTMVRLLDQVIATKTTEERQSALLTLGELSSRESHAALDKLIIKLGQGSLPPEIHLELAEAVEKSKSNELSTKLKSLSASSFKDTLTAPYQAALMGGNPNRGADIFYGHQAAQCIRCHAYGDYGGNAGPQLNGVATRLSRGQLLESLVNPSARIAPGYGTTTVELTGGKKITGLLTKENKTELSLRVGNRPDTVILKAQISKQVTAPSSMPPMGYLLSKKEIRDLVSFLATLKD